jgi:putative hydrolase of the HAD superfamily
MRMMTSQLVRTALRDVSRCGFERNRPLLTKRHMGIWLKMHPRRIRVITSDVTGTLVSFRGSLSEHYLGCAQKCGIDIPQDARFEAAFKQAYNETCRVYPCFGSDQLTAKEWWRLVVQKSFSLAGTNMTEAQADIVFQRIYSIFGSLVAYEKFDDALPFLNWAKRKKLVCGVLSNADERYGDSILPMLGLTHDQLQFQCFSKDVGFEKPDGRFYHAALKQADVVLHQNLLIAGKKGELKSKMNITDEDPLLPSHVLHIGNDFTKDFEGARRAGFHSVLMNRYNENEQAAEWKRRGALVFNDLLDIVEFLGRSNCKFG